MRFIPVIALLGACMPHPDKSGPDAACDVGRYAGLIGQNIAAVSGPASPMLRLIGPDTMVTYDYRPDRTNIYFGADGIITRVACG